MTAAKAPKPRTVKDAAREEELTAFEHFQELGTGLHVAVTRHPNRYLEILPLEGLDEELMRERYGGGKFQLRVREDGAFKKGAKVRWVEIEGAPKLFPPASADPNTPEILRLQNELAVLNGKGDGSTTMLTVVGLLAPVLTAMVGAMMDRPAAPDPLETLNLFRKMLKDDRADRPVAGESGLDPIVEKLGLPLLGEIQKLRQIGAGNGATTPNPPTLTPAAVGSKSPETLAELAQFVANYAAVHCRRGTNPQLRAEVFLEELTIQDPGLYPSVVELSRVPDVLDYWVKLVPDVALNREWHGAFIREIRELADLSDQQPAAADVIGAGAEDSDTPDPERGRGDAGDTGGDGEAVTAGVAG